ncbi:MAG: hypothetical protein NTY50_12060 [Methylobacter sp.]|nr:hypothetical protein [Methylobacter sp.]
MKKPAFLLLWITGLLASSMLYAKPAPIVETRHAIEISIGGIGPGVDPVAYKKLRQLLGNAVAASVIDKFVIYGYGREGGFSACVEDRPSAQPPSKAFEKFVKQLNGIKPDPSTSFYSVNRLLTCPPLPAASDTVRVAKSDESKQCENNGISLADMQQQLGDIRVYVASKEHDDLARIALCGADTGIFNVYVIAAGDLEQAIAAGFSEWTYPSEAR